jgi:hypothetical protein
MTQTIFNHLLNFPAPARVLKEGGYPESLSYEQKDGEARVEA